jgi:hypothetical protein
MDLDAPGKRVSRNVLCSGYLFIGHVSRVSLYEIMSSAPNHHTALWATGDLTCTTTLEANSISTPEFSFQDCEETHIAYDKRVAIGTPVEMAGVG